ncbi:hypothetical protein PRZ48_014539 [Zasmidium cellare]|uniref:Uncharacterized protein n=1 Tax=Zasmidium cellare TaxID=395010 RepID=A0ABR0DZ11_ZASCE|nr:hypothetical protein PRZ48_014539 [Zasmidium cellare]
MSTAADASVLRLQRNLARIPQELYDEILDLVLTPTTSTVTIDKTYKPPPQIHISRATRTIAATRYYSDTAFIIHQGEDHAGGYREDIWLQWLTSPPKEHVQMMKTYYKTARKEQIDPWGQAVSKAYWDAEALWNLAAYCGAPVHPKNVFTNVEYKDEDGTVKEVWKDGDFLVKKWIENGAPILFRSGGANFDSDDEDSEDSEDGEVGEGDDDEGVGSGDEEDEGQGEAKEPGKTRFASKNPFDLLAG